ncbi:MAG TPA: ComEC/Rec2 family competence protein, partial [Gemmatimonadales bacterium]|nr:ComEC/Rec2 family competence protein [Gemmatimonadales bacterium]
IDAGPIGPHEDAGRQVVVPFLRRHGAGRIDVLVISHAHADHLGGARALLDRIPTGLVTEPGELVSDSLYGGFLDEVAALGIPWRAGRPGDHFELDGVQFRFLHPDPAWPGWGTDLNEDSLVLLVEYGEFQALFSGDIGFPVEQLLKGRVGPIDLLKVGHHGSAGSSSDAWLSELQPRAAVISVGVGNRYGHPAPSALARLAAHHIAIWRTDRDGTVTVQTDGRTLTVRGRRGIERYSTSPTEELSR